MSPAFCKIVGCLLPGRNLVKIWYNMDCFFIGFFRELGDSKFISEKICGDV